MDTRCEYCQCRQGELHKDSCPVIAEQFHIKRPPLGITPRFILMDRRRFEILQGMDRMAAACRPIPVEWVEEYNEIVNRLNKTKT